MSGAEREWGSGKSGERERSGERPGGREAGAGRRAGVTKIGLSGVEAKSD